VTKFGHNLVFVVLVLSIACSAWAGAVYFHTRGGDATERKELAKQLADKKKATKTEGDDRAKDVQAAAGQLNKLDKDLADNERWYQDQLAILKTGKDTNGQKAAAPVQALARDAKSGVQTDANGRPTFQGPIPDLADYETTLDQIKNDRVKLQQERDAVQQLIAQNQELSDKINGAKGKPQGLRELLADEWRKEREAREQQGFLDPLLFNRQVERQLLEKRHEMLEARVRELHAPAAASTASRPSVQGTSLRSAGARRAE
jgi:hypothetical protein